MHEYGINLITQLSKYDGIVLAVSHTDFIKLDYNELKSENSSIIFDIKAVLVRGIVDARL